MTNMKEKKMPTSVGQKVIAVLGIVLCVILVSILMINIVLIITSLVKPDSVPNVGGWMPMVVVTDSMYPDIQSGDMIFCKRTEPEDVQVGDVITFFDPEGNGTSVVTHRVIEVIQENGMLSFRTKGDANNTADRMAVAADKLVGVYHGRIAGLGNVTLFMQTTAGFIVCVICPVLLLVGWDVLRRRKYEKAHRQDTEALVRELEELRAAKAIDEGSASK